MPGVQQNRGDFLEKSVHSLTRKGVLLAALLVLPAFAGAQTVPTWVSATPVITKGGLATLQWSIAGTESIALFRISEEAHGERHVIFTDQSEIRLLRNQPGDYRYRVQTCVSLSGDYPRCSSPSQTLTLTVLDALSADAPVTGFCGNAAGLREPGTTGCSDSSNHLNPASRPGQVTGLAPERGKKS